MLVYMAGQVHTHGIRLGSKHINTRIVYNNKSAIPRQYLFNFLLMIDQRIIFPSDLELKMSIYLTLATNAQIASIRNNKQTFFKSFHLCVSRFGLLPCWIALVMVCGRSDLCPFLSVTIETCGSFDLWPFQLVVVPVVRLLLCGRYNLLLQQHASLSPSWFELEQKCNDISRDRVGDCHHYRLIYEKHIRGR